MARIRTIKPEFWTSEQVMECSLNARLLFVGMWNFADDHGRMPLAPKTIKAQVFPGDDIPVDTIRGWVLELSAKGLILIYAVEAKEYLEITGWKHQRIDKPQKAKYPGPFDENSKTIPRMFDVGREKEGKGEERTTPRKRATPRLLSPLPDGFTCSEGNQDFAKSKGLSVNDELERFCANARAKGLEYKDWDAAFRTWLLNSAKWKLERQQPVTFRNAV